MMAPRPPSGHPVSRRTAFSVEGSPVASLRSLSLSLPGAIHRGDGCTDRFPRAADVTGGGLRGTRARFRPPAARVQPLPILDEVEEGTPHGGGRPVRAFSRSDLLLTPTGTFSKIATLPGIFPARNLTEKYHQVSVDHYTRVPFPESGSASIEFRGDRCSRCPDSFRPRCLGS